METRKSIKMETQNQPKWGPEIDQNGDPKIDQNGGPKIDQNGDPKSIKMGTQNRSTWGPKIGGILPDYIGSHWGNRLLLYSYFRIRRVSSQLSEFDRFWILILIDFGSPFWSIFGSPFWSILGPHFGSILGPHFDRFWVPILIDFGSPFWIDLGVPILDQKNPDSNGDWGSKSGPKNRYQNRDPQKSRSKWRPSKNPDPK